MDTSRSTCDDLVPVFFLTPGRVPLARHRRHSICSDMDNNEEEDTAPCLITQNLTLTIDNQMLHSLQLNNHDPTIDPGFPLRQPCVLQYRHACENSFEITKYLLHHQNNHLSLLPKKPASCLHWVKRTRKVRNWE